MLNSGEIVIQTNGSHLTVIFVDRSQLPRVCVTWFGGRDRGDGTSYYRVQDERYGPRPRMMTGRELDRLKFKLKKLPLSVSQDKQED